MDDGLLERIVAEYPDKLHYPFDGFYRAAGFTALCACADFFGGTSLYIPSKGNLFKGCMQNAFAREYDGYNLREACRKFGLSERTARYIIQGN